MVVINAACRAKDVAWIRARGAGASLHDLSDDLALLAVQGPRAVQVVSGMTDDDVTGVRPFHFVDTNVAGVHAAVSRTGYTGEGGFELYVGAPPGAGWWGALVDT